MEYRPPVSMIPFAQLQVERTLAFPGQVLVQVGDKVDPTDVIARALRSGPLHAVHAARALGVSHLNLPRYVVKHQGEDVQRHEVLAARGGVLGLFRKKYLSPVAGSVLAITQGRILLEETPTEVELRAGVKGEVVQVNPGRGATIRTTGAMIRAAWSSQVEGEGANAGLGVIRVLTPSRDEPLTADVLDLSCQGAIVVGGSMVDAEALQRAGEVNVRAVIVGGLEASLREVARALPFPVVAMEGFGTIPMTEPIFQLLWLHQGREAFIVHGMRSMHASAGGRTRPEILIPLPLDPSRALSEAALLAEVEVGMQVRLLRAPYAGQVGQVATAPARMQDPATGLRFYGIQIKLEGDRSIAAPVANVEVIRSR